MPILHKGQHDQMPAGHSHARVALVPVAGKEIASTIDFVDGGHRQRAILKTSELPAKSFSGGAGSTVTCIGPGTVNVIWS